MLLQHHHLAHLLLSPTVLSPVPLHLVVTVLGHHQRPLLVVAPDHQVFVGRVVLDGLIVSLGEELVVEDSLSKDEPVTKWSQSIKTSSKVSPVSLLLPESDLVCDGGRDVGGHLVGGHHVHVEESDDLVGCDASPDVGVKMLSIIYTSIVRLT